MILVDNSEPENIIKLIRQAVPVTVLPLNRQHMSDYFFSNHEGKSFQFSRKQAGELVGNIDEAEDQLRDYYPQADENFQIVEGIMSPVKIHSFPISDHSLAPSKISTRDLGAKVYCYQVQPNGHIAKGHSFSVISLPVYYAWRHRLAQCGIVTYETMNWVETARLLTTIYRNEQRSPEHHSTLQRIIKPRIVIKDQDPFVKALMFLSSAYKLDIGEVKANALAERFCHLLDLATSDIDSIVEIEGIGKVTASKLLSALGRDL